MTSAPSPVGSIVIPAWNEAAVIERTLTALQSEVPSGAFEVIVACNGCTDRTAEVARGAAPHAIVLDLPAVGKARAIRAAEDVATTMPRLYLDADVELAGISAMAVLEALAADAVAARPPVSQDLDDASWAVRTYHSARAALPSISAELFGAGVYGLSTTARGRFEEFPDVIADDLFAARIVSQGEVVVVDCPPVRVRAPRDARSLLDTLTRVQRGNRELEQTMPSLAPSTTRATLSGLRRLARSPRRWPSLLVYVAFTVAARWRAGCTRPAGWERDESARRAHIGS